MRNESNIMYHTERNINMFISINVILVHKSTVVKNKQTCSKTPEIENSK